MTPRDLGKLAAAGGLGRCAPSASDGPLEGYEGKVDLTTFDTVLYTRKLYEAAPLRLTFRSASRKQAEAWQKRLRAKLVEILGGSRQSLRPSNR
jgi:hypothetical protein